MNIIKKEKINYPKMYYKKTVSGKKLAIFFHFQENSTAELLCIFM